MAKENGGIIGVVNTPTQSVASGVWASQDQYNARVGDIWPGQPYSIDFLVIAGGGGGGSGAVAPNNGGGGGAGGYRTSTQTVSGGTVITVTVGDGGALDVSGNASEISGSGLTTITSAGGGHGGGDPTEYLEAKGRDWNKTPDMQLLRSEFDRENSDLDAEAREELFAKKLSDEYGMNPDGSFEDADSKAARIGKQLMERDAKKLRSQRIAEQEKFKIPERKKVEEKVQQEEYDPTEEYNRLVELDEIKPIISSKMIPVGDTGYGFELENPEEVIGMMADTRKFWSVFKDSEGNLNLQAVAKVMAIAKNQAQYEKDLLQLGGDLAMEGYLKTKKNVKDVSSDKPDLNKDLPDSGEFDPDAFMKEALRQKRAKQKV